MTAIPYTIVRSDRKTVALVVNSEAQLVVRAPYRVSEREIDSCVKKKERWILEKQLQISAFGEKHSQIMAANGETVLYLGNAYTIQRGDYEHISINSTFLHVPREYKIDDIIAWLKEEALHVVTERTVFYADLMGVKFSAIKLSEAKSRWGSCSAKNSLNFAWRLILCPVAAIDYIVVHELSHIKYKNHGAEFWARVKTVLPNYKEQQDWLKLNRKLMEII